jgi:hypothetical protein
MPTEPDPQVMRLRVANTSSYVNVLWSPGGDTDWPLELGPDDVTVTLYDGNRGGELAAKLYSIPAFLGGDASWVIRRDLAEEMFDGVNGVYLRRVRFVHERKLLKGDHVFIDVQADRLLDRDRAVATYTDRARPWASTVTELDTVHVLGIRPGSLVFARVTEFPDTLVASPALVTRWKALKAPVEVVKPPHGSRVGMPVFNLSYGNPPPFPKLGDARPVAMTATVAAFHKALDGDRTSRSHAIEHPLFAYAIARLIDHEPHADTRKSAIRHPTTAALYARFVDKAARNDTRNAAAEWAATAEWYACYVDKKLREPCRKTLVKRMAPGDLATLESRLGLMPASAP